LGLQCLRIVLDGNIYCLEGDSVEGKDFSSEIRFKDVPRGTLDVTAGNEIVNESETAIMPAVLQMTVDLLARVIGWMVESREMENCVEKNRSQLTGLKEIVDRQQEINDPLQAVQASACLLLERSGSADSTDRARLSIIDEQVSEIRRTIKEISAISDKINWTFK